MRLSTCALALLTSVLCNTLVLAAGANDEVWRPQFHFTPAKGWMNDPNGLVYDEGEYHLFYQHNPASTGWISELSWGHAVARDLVHWEHLSPVLPPTPMAGKGPAGSWSGSGLVDEKNTAEFQSGNEKPLVVVWTAAGLGQCIAFSNDRGRTFTSYEHNPVIPMDPPRKGDWDRDPKVYWNDSIGQWTMAFSVSGQGMKFYTSPDLKTWTYQSLLPGLFECPDYFELPVDGNPQQKKWVIWDASGKYFIGSFDGKKFKPEAGPFMIDAGANYYAAQTWSNAPEGRRISIGWMREAKFPGMPFNGQMGIPSELSLRTLPEGVRLTKVPVKEVETLRGSEKKWENQPLENGKNLLSDLAGDGFDLVAEIEPGSSKGFAFHIRGTPVQWADGQLKCLGKSVTLKPVEGRVKLRVLVDRTSLEIYGNDGAASMTSAFLPPEKDTGVSLSAMGDGAKVISLHAFLMQSAAAR